ncbi:uncharacterized protein LOC142765049 [Rhipicephalus microplus]|uniref:uncharacterized protein LOC142765049 n=1 Tax=Rhipicephalus microplus TaxID=6941 RepID=UPI003F6D7A77
MLFVHEIPRSIGGNVNEPFGTFALICGRHLAASLVILLLTRVGQPSLAMTSTELAHANCCLSYLFLRSPMASVVVWTNLLAPPQCFGDGATLNMAHCCYPWNSVALPRVGRSSLPVTRTCSWLLQTAFKSTCS